MKNKSNGRKGAGREKDPYLWDEGTGKLGERGPSGDVGIPEAFNQKDVQNEKDEDKRESRETNVSDLNDPGDPEAEDVGIPGGAESGGEMAEGGSGGVEKDNEDDSDLDNDGRKPGRGTGAPENFLGNTFADRK